MAYRFKLDEPLDKGVRRVAREQIARARRELHCNSGDIIAASGVHESRKAIKRLRALLRFVKPEIGGKAFAARNAGLRDIAAALSSARDQSILDETIAKLEARFGDQGVVNLTPLRRRLVELRASIREPLDASRVQSIQDMISREGRGLDTLEFKRGGFEILAEGLEQSYAKGRTAFAKACKKPSDDRVHDLRKGVQWHWRQMALISRAWSPYFEVRVAAARELSQILGDDHDLAVLVHFAKSEAAAVGSASGAIVKMARARQQELRDEAQPLATRLFAESPEDFVRRIACYWEAGRKLKPHDEATGVEPREFEIMAPAVAKSSAPRLTVKADDDAPSRRRA